MNLLALRPSRLRRLFNLWLPFLFTGIRVLAISEDWSSARVRLRRYRFNRNFIGTHFGGSLFAMTDPFWMILLIHRLGTDYLVWDQAGTIDFVKATREDVFADFQLDAAVVDEIRAAAADGQKHLRWFDTDVKTADGELIARVRNRWAHQLLQPLAVEHIGLAAGHILHMPRIHQMHHQPARGQ